MRARDKAIWANGRELDQEHSAPGTDRRKSTALDHSLVDLILKKLGCPNLEIILWDGTRLSKQHPGSHFTYHDELYIRNRGTLFQLIRNPELHFGDLYSSGHIQLKGDLIRFFEIIYGSMNHASESRGPVKKFWSTLRSPKPRRNTLRNAQTHIHHHYDISNDFYRLWLDNRHMQYTCAYYAQPDFTLEQAQEAKLEHVCRKLQLQPGETVVEAGCGWGGLARYMAKHYGVKVKAYNISREQVAYARQAAKEQGLDHLVEYVEDDYRNITGEYDVFVSIGMLEHIGAENMSVLGSTINRVLKQDGRGLIHSIGRNRPKLMNAWIEKRIFPGAYPPSISEMMEIFEPQDFSILDIENLRLHYAQTLRHWLGRFDEHQALIENMFDREFFRAWRLYLAGSVAAFTAGDLQLFQALFSRPTLNTMPLTRDHLYRTEK
ncbi:MAG: cyclopropane-fatty-acyl-phospholipid synthase family protein [Gammaproteobacteria bacterium]|nr:cyclopropane-fatty-acyl-phospholipid synthase family protein [Gammaproteobacteria bacterium]